MSMFQFYKKIRKATFLFIFFVVPFVVSADVGDTVYHIGTTTKGATGIPSTAEIYEGIIIREDPGKDPIVRFEKKHTYKYFSEKPSVVPDPDGGWIYTTVPNDKEGVVYGDCSGSAAHCVESTEEVEEGKKVRSIPNEELVKKNDNSANPIVTAGGDALKNNQEVDVQFPSDSDPATLPTSTPDPLTDTDGDGAPDDKDNAPNHYNPDQLDTDGDGEGDVSDSDDDNDGFSDEFEESAGTDPNNPDSDGDGVNDKEDYNPLDPNVSQDPSSSVSTDDTDGDGISDKDEEFLGTDPKEEDTDDDGVSDYDEIKNGTDPDENGSDSDGDGLSDTQEKIIDTDPTREDSDGDGDKDGDDPDPNNPNVFTDSDGDGLSNGYEEALGTNPNKADSDGDGVDDATEIANGTDPYDPDKGGTDSDGDGASDVQEKLKNTNPYHEDSDRDGIGDLEEIEAGTNPKHDVVYPTGTATGSGGSSGSCSLANPFDGPIVPCGTKANPESCTLCHLLELFQNIFCFLYGILVTVALALITVSGVLYIVSAGAALKTLAKNIITKTLTGFLIFLLSWLIVFSVLKASSWKDTGNWWELNCEAESVFDKK